MLAAHVVAVLGPERQGPHLFARRGRTLLEARAQRWVVAEEARAEVAERRDHATGEGGQIDEVRRLERAARPTHGIGEHQAPFGIGVGDFDGHAVVHRDDVVGAVGLAVDHVLRGAEHRGHAHGQVERCDGLHRAEHGGAAHLVVLHALHAVVDLEAVAAGVVGQGLADEHEVLAARAAGEPAGCMLEHGDAGLGGRALAHVDESAHAELLGLAEVDHAVLEAGLAGEGARLRIDPLGVADVRRRGAESARCIHGISHDESALERFAGLGCVRPDGERSTAWLLARGRAIEVIEAPLRDRDALGERGGMPLHQHGGVQRDGRGSGSVEPLGEPGSDRAHSRGGQVLLGAEAYDQARVAHQQALAGIGAEPRAGERCTHACCDRRLLRWRRAIVAEDERDLKRRTDLTHGDGLEHGAEC